MKLHTILFLIIALFLKLVNASNTSIAICYENASFGTNLLSNQTDLSSNQTDLLSSSRQMGLEWTYQNYHSFCSCISDTNGEFTCNCTRYNHEMMSPRNILHSFLFSIICIGLICLFLIIFVLCY